MNILPMSGRSDPDRNTSTAAKKRPIRLLRLLQPSPKAEKAAFPRRSTPPQFNGKYSDVPFSDSAIGVANEAKAQTTRIGKVLIENLQSKDTP
jgi:hypothetical protein